MQMHRKFLTFLVILVLLVSPLTVIPNVYASTVETRYFTSTSETYKGITVKKLLTSNSASALSAEIAYGRRFGVRVWKTTVDGTETEITSGTPVATVIHFGTSDDDGEYSASWACPETSLVATDRIVVRVYSSKVTPVSWQLLQTFITEPLGASKVDSATWTVYYWLYISGTTVSFWYGSSTYDSRITNFVWTPAVTTAWHDVSSWTASLVTKTWSSGTSWTANLIARIWSSGTSFNFSLQTRIWSNVAFLDGIATELIDSYDESNYNYTSYLMGHHPSDNPHISAEGQSFTMLSSDRMITSCKFYLYKLGSPTGMAHAVLYAHQGIYGTNSTPIGDALATSDDFDVSTLTTSIQLITFTFNSSQQYLMKANTYYCIAFENPMSGTINVYNCPLMGFEWGSPTHSGSNFLFKNSSYFPAFTSFDTVFYVYGRQTGGVSLLTRQYLAVASWLFDFGTKIWMDIAKMWTYDWVTMAWENISWIFYLGTSIWTNIATWGISLTTRMWNDIAIYTINLLTMAWHDLTWLFTLLPALPEWVNVAVWIFHLVPAEWIFPFIWIIMLGFIGLCCLVVSAKPQKKRETENV